MEFWSSLGNILWFSLSIFVIVGYLSAVFRIISDLFRDQELSGWVKALWLVCLLFLPILTALVYLIFRGRGMGERATRQALAMQQQAEDYIREVSSGRSPAHEIAQAQELREAGTITEEEFEALKRHALRTTEHANERG